MVKILKLSKLFENVGVIYVPKKEKYCFCVWLDQEKYYKLK